MVDLCNNMLVEETGRQFALLALPSPPKAQGVVGFAQPYCPPLVNPFSASGFQIGQLFLSTPHRRSSQRQRPVIHGAASDAHVVAGAATAGPVITRAASAAPVIAGAASAAPAIDGAAIAKATSARPDSCLNAGPASKLTPACSRC